MNEPFPLNDDGDDDGDDDIAHRPRALGPPSERHVRTVFCCFIFFFSEFAALSPLTRAQIRRLIC